MWWISLALAQCVDVEQGRGCRQDLAGWRVLDLHGTDHAIGQAYGELLKEELVGYWIPMVEEMHFARMPGVFRKLLARHRKHFPDYFDARASERARGLEAALSVEAGTVERYAWLADLASIGPALQLALGRTVQVDPVTGSVGNRCTSVVASDGEHTLLARNLDFWGMGEWQPRATLTFVEPLDGEGEPNGYRYSQVGTVGEVFAGSSGLNERGLAVTSHLHVTRDAALVFGRPRMKTPALLWEGLTGSHPRGGTAIYVLFERLLRDAADVDEAIAILEEVQPVGAWSFVLADPSGDRAVVGRSYSDIHVARGHSVNTNFYLDEAMHARELHPARGPLEGARMRYARAEELLGDGELTVPQAADLLRDRWDAAVERDRPLSANSVLSADTSQSVVLELSPDGAHILWLADPHADGFTPAALAGFTAFPFADGFAPGRSRGAQLPAPPVAHAEPMAAYLKAMHQRTDLHDPAAAAGTLREIDTDDAGIRLMSAWATAATGDLQAAGAELKRVDRAHLSEHHGVLAGWLEGEIAARTGRPEEAVRIWTEVRDGLDGDDPPACGDLDEMLRLVLQDRLDGGWKKTELPFPDLKFQDVIELRLGRQ
ncbi:MAG: C45 family peptidase [Myxococcota bacterium]